MFRWCRGLHNGRRTPYRAASFVCLCGLVDLLLYAIGVAHVFEGALAIFASRLDRNISGPDNAFPHRLLEIDVVDSRQRDFDATLSDYARSKYDSFARDNEVGECPVEILDDKPASPCHSQQRPNPQEDLLSIASESRNHSYEQQCEWNARPNLLSEEPPVWSQIETYRLIVLQKSCRVGHGQIVRLKRYVVDDLAPSGSPSPCQFSGIVALARGTLVRDLGGQGD